MASQSQSPIAPNDDPPPSSSLYPVLYIRDVIGDLSSGVDSDSDSDSYSDSDQSSSSDDDGDDDDDHPNPITIGEPLITIPAAILHLIDKTCSVQLATGDFRIIHLRQGHNNLATLASVADDVQWPLAKDITVVKLDASHYFFSFQAPDDDDDDEDNNNNPRNKKNEKENQVLSYGLTIPTKGQEKLLQELDRILESFSKFSVQKVEEKAAEAMVGSGAVEITAGELKTDEKKKEEMEGQCAVYWTTLAPNVEDYSSVAAKLVAIGSGQLVKGILWCGDITIERLHWGNEVLMEKMGPGTKKEIDPATLKRIKRVKKMTKMTEKVAKGVLSGVVTVSGFFTSSVSNSTVGKKFIDMLPGEVVLASLDGFSRLCDAVEVAGTNVASTTSTVTTGLVTQKYGEEAAEVAMEGLDAAGHAMGAAWAVFQIRRGLINPNGMNNNNNNVMDLHPSNLSKSAAKAAEEIRAKEGKKKKKKKNKKK